MKELLIYFAQANVALALFAISYRYLLSRDTLFNLRRVLLLVMILLSFTFQFLPSVVKVDLFSPTAGTNLINLSQLNIVETEVAVTQASSISIATILIALWLTGCVVLTIRLIMGFIAILQIRARGCERVINGIKTTVIARELAPFSFYRWIFISPKELSSVNIDDVVTHERAHVEEMHSVDVMIGELLTIIFWFNPAVWFIRYAIRENLEFLADKNVLDCGHDRKEYQYNLLKLSYQPTTNNIVNYFNVSQLKNRIIMMNREKTPKRAILKYALLLPVLALISVTNSASAQNNDNIKVVGYSSVKDLSADTLILRSSSAATVLFIINGAESDKKTFDAIAPENIESIYVLKDKSAADIYGDKGKNGVIIVTTKEIKALSTEKDKATDIEVSKGQSVLEKINIGALDKNPPLIFLDGKEITNEELSTTTPDNIESISVLKDANATKVYGDKGKNGVIIVTTKK